MLENRLSEYWTEVDSQLGHAPMPAFVACPIPVLQTMMPTELLRGDFLYRLAWEQAQAQLAFSQRDPWEFSRN